MRFLAIFLILLSACSHLLPPNLSAPPQVEVVFIGEPAPPDLVERIIERCQHFCRSRHEGVSLKSVKIEHFPDRRHTNVLYLCDIK